MESLSTMKSPTRDPSDGGPVDCAPGDPLEPATLRKVTRRLIPLLFLLYIVCVIDRANVGLAALQMNRDLGFSAAVYGLGAGIFFLGYSLFEVPSNLILARVGARRWIARIAVTWGVLASAMIFVRSAESFYALRLLLGVAEAGYFPGIIYYLGQWFPERQRARAMSRFMLGIPIAGIIGGPLGGALLGLDGHLGLAGWQWLFLLEGLPAVVLGVVVFAWLTDRPEDARWLTRAERGWLRARLRAEELEGGDTREASVRRALSSGAVWRLSLPYIMMGIGAYSITFWGPTIVKGLLGLSDQGVGLAVGAISFAGVIGMLANGSHSDRTGERVLHAAVPLLVAALGFAVSALVREPALAVLGLALALLGLYGFMPAFWCLPTALLRGTAAAGGIALINSIGNLGGFLGPTVLGSVKEATGSFTGSLLAMAGLSAAGALLLLWLHRARRDGAAPRPDLPGLIRPSEEERR